MARVDIQDCLQQIANPFALVRIAAKRSRQLERGAVSKLPYSDHKPTVQALEEVATGLVTETVLGEVDLPPVTHERLEFPSHDIQII